jgi:hypothetical protein
VKIEELKKAKDERPFQPFRIRLTDGKEIPIKHPDAVAWEDDKARIALVVSEGENYWIEMALVTALVRSVPIVPASGNGGA